MSIQSDLSRRFSDSNAAPILFVGSGFSRRYLGAPTWPDLLAKFAAETSNPYSYYYSKASGDMPLAGSLVSSAFHEVWFSNPKFEVSRKEFEAECRNVSDPLKFEVAKYLSSCDQVIDHDDELESLRKVPLEAIITTNYDRLVESQFPEYQVYNGQDSMILNRSYGFGEIYKIHGCVKEPKSIVLTKEDYEVFESRNLILAAKLLTLIVEHPIVFLGYSVSDSNVRTILTSIIKCLSPEGIALVRDSIFIAEWDETAEESIQSSSMRIENIDLQYTHIKCQEFQTIYECMSSFERRFPVKMLRDLKKAVYDLVETTDPSGKVAVMNIDSDADLEKADFVLGVGVKAKLTEVGYVGMSRDDVFGYALSGGEYDPDLILKIVVPNMIKGNASCPMFRFLAEAGRLKGGSINLTGLPQAVSELSGASPEKYVHSAYAKSKAQINADFHSLKALIDSYESEAIYRIALLDRDKVDLELLQKFLVGTRDEFRNLGGGFYSNWRKLVCYFDRIAYGP